SVDSVVWSLPAGSIELGESPEAAVVREVYEETGLMVKPVRLAGVFGGSDFRFTDPDGNQVEYVVCLFVCAITGGTLQALDGESADLQWFSTEKMPPLALPYPPELFKSSSEMDLMVK
ncbi:MAG: NUDIX domain-containing protein, partial [Firmicutes bacterium]|nr:NUDIX domain-containing protein [Bacillota bacterium]